MYLHIKIIMKFIHLLSHPVIDPSIHSSIHPYMHSSIDQYIHQSIPSVGAPSLPSFIRGSISHKDRLVVSVARFISHNASINSTDSTSINGLNNFDSGEYLSIISS
jgi:hypothetical protein